MGEPKPKYLNYFMDSIYFLQKSTVTEHMYCLHVPGMTGVVV